MATQVQRRRGTTLQHAAFSGQLAEITIDTDKMTVVVQDGSTLGGFPLAKESDLTADNITITDTAGNFTATDVEGALAELAAPSGGLTYFTEARSTTAPNATVPAHSFTATGAETNIDAVISPKGTGAITTDIPDNTATGGNKRGSRSVDLQRSRSAAAQVASGASSALLGGYSNIASGEGSVAIGGATNTASNFYSIVIAGTNNTASGAYSVAGGVSCTASGTSSIALGSYNTASAQYSAILAGHANTVSGARSVSLGGTYGKDNGNQSCIVYGTYSSGPTAGFRQLLLQQVYGSTTDATTTALTADGSTVGATNILAMEDGHLVGFSSLIYAREAATGDCKVWKVEGAIKRGTGAATTALVGTTTVTAIAADAGAATWTADAVADTTIGGLKLQVTGEAAHNISWVGSIYSIYGI